MKSFQKIKDDVKSFSVTDPQRESKYGKFLDSLVEPQNNQRGSNPLWDLWYFSDNTEFCRDSAALYLKEINESETEHRLLHKGQTSKFNFNNLRRQFGSFSFYLYSALESFSHEINLFYELGLQRKSVSIKRVEESLPSSASLKAHVSLSRTDPVVVRALEYRDANMHGYVFPLSGEENGIFLTDSPKLELFRTHPRMTDTLEDFCTKSFEKVSALICQGWRCFENDHLN